jgi:hypothetical protein
MKLGIIDNEKEIIPNKTVKKDRKIDNNTD